MKHLLPIIILSFLLCPSFVFAQEDQPTEDTETVIPVYFFANEGGNIFGITPISEDQFLWFYPLSEEEAQITQESGADVVRVNFTGHEYDDATDLYYMGARYQDPEIGRFVSQDPIHQDIGMDDLKQKYGKELSQILIDPQSLNSYSYVKNNPLRYIDPDGQNYVELSLSADMQPFGVLFGVQIDEKGIDWVAGGGLSIGGGWTVQAAYSFGDLSHQSELTESFGVKGAYFLGLGASRNKNIDLKDSGSSSVGSDAWNEFSVIGGMGASASVEIKKSGPIKLFNQQKDNKNQSVQQTINNSNSKKVNTPSQIKNVSSPNQCVETNLRSPKQNLTQTRKNN